MANRLGNRLENKVALITGAGTGIGAATAQRFAEEGALAVLCGRRREPLEEVAASIGKAGGRARVEPLDVTKEADVDALVKRLADEEGHLDILINNAVLLVPGMVEGMDSKTWHQNFLVSLDGAFYCMRAAMRQMRKQGSGGSVVNISSVLGLMTAPGTAGYGASKAALLSLTRTAAIEGANANIRVNAIVPGAFLTPPTEEVLPTEEARQQTAGLIPLKRIGDPRECANAILFMASDEASYVTGQSLVVDGGRVAELYSGPADWSE